MNAVRRIAGCCGDSCRSSCGIANAFCGVATHTRRVSTGASTSHTLASIQARREALVQSLLKPETSVRLDNVLAQNGRCPRRYARQFCRNYEVKEMLPNGVMIPILTGATKVNPLNILIDGEKLQYVGAPMHIILHKPAGYVCSHSEGDDQTIYDLFPKAFMMRKPLLSSIGRLDKLATGLLLLSQNGGLNARLTSPKRHCPKEYHVSLKDPLSTAGFEAAAFASGKLQLVDGANCKPARIVPHKAHRNICKVVLTEGRYHQIRRMFAAVGHCVTAIHRTTFAGLRLVDTGLAPGQWAMLTQAQLEILLRNSEQKQRAARSHGDGAKIRRESLDEYDDEEINIAEDDDYSDVDVAE
jgi:16S rRNA pseudouridine516 synthase